MIRQVCVVGLGHVGLPTAALLARAGLEVTGCDTAPEVVSAVNAGRVPDTEPGLAALVRDATASGRLRAQTRPAPADAILIAVPTPVTPPGHADLAAVEAACDSIAPHLRAGDLIVLESTCPVGTTERIAGRLAALRPGLHLHLAACPERVLPGDALREIVANDRVIGGLTPACAERASGLYAHFVTGALTLTDSRTAEFVKLAENAHRDVAIAFANELAAVAERLGVAAGEAIALANRHPRVTILSPGIGVGGHCIPVDPLFLIEAAPQATALMRAARAVNDARPAEIASRLRAACAGLRDPLVALFGLTYKPDAADMRNSPAVTIAELLSRDDALRLLVCDPHVVTLPEALRGRPVTLTTADAAMATADIAAILVPHRAFAALPGAAPTGQPWRVRR